MTMTTARAIIIFCGGALVMFGTAYGLSSIGDQPQPQINSDDASATALDAVPGGTIEELELDVEAGVIVWEVEVLDPGGVEHQIQVDATTGAVRTHGIAPGPEGTEDQVAPFIDADDAVDAALEVVPEGTIEEVELGNEAGVLVWEIEVLDHTGVEHDVVVDATTGTVLSNAVDSDADDDDDDDATGPRSPGTVTTPSAGPHAIVPGPAVLIGAGDIASCESDGDEATAALLDTVAGTVAVLGDAAYGDTAPLSNCYEPSWGRHRARTRPTPGNHDYGSGSAEAYFDYFGAAAGEPDNGYYSYDLGTWHVVVLNSNCEEIAGRCAAGSPQEQWLRQDLAAHRTTCAVAYYHHPRFSSGSHGSADDMAALWKALYDAGVDVALSGHDHDYERLAPLDASGRVDGERGIRSFIVGTGGKSLREFGEVVVAGSEVRSNETFGVLKLTLGEGRYDWEFLPVAGGTFTDRGGGTCH